MLDIKLNPNNPRTIKDDKFKKLCKSLKANPEYLEARPIVVKDGVIYGGNMRYLALLENKMEIKPEWIKDVSGWTDEAIRKFIVVDNMPYGDNDWDSLANQYEKEELEDWGMDVDKWVDDEVVEDEVPEVTENPVSKLGEIYQLGRHRIMCGDSTKIEDVEKLMDGKKADMVFTDPPYALFGNSTGVAGIVDDKMVRPFFRDIFNQCKKFTKRYGHVYACCDWRSAFVIESIAREVELTAKNMCIWYKGQNGVGGMYFSCYEIVWFFANSPIPKTTMGHGGSGERTVNGISNVWEVKREKEGLHNAQKPVEMIQIPIKAGADEGQIVLDLFLGSGSTLITCEQTNRICYGMEIDPKYTDVIRRRYWKFVNNGDETGWEEGTPCMA